MLRNWWRKCRQKRAERRFWRLVLWQLATTQQASESAHQTLWMMLVLTVVAGVAALMAQLPFDKTLAGMLIANILELVAYCRWQRAEDWCMAEFLALGNGVESPDCSIEIDGHELVMSRKSGELLRVPVDGDNAKLLQRLSEALDPLVRRNWLVLKEFCDAFGYVSNLTEDFPHVVAEINRQWDERLKLKYRVRLTSPLAELRLVGLHRYELKERRAIARLRVQMERCRLQSEQKARRRQQLKESWPALIVRTIGYLATWLWQQSSVCQWLQARATRRQKAEDDRLERLQADAQAVLAGEAGEAAISRLEQEDDLTPSASGISRAPRLSGTELPEASDSA